MAKSRAWPTTPASLALTIFCRMLSSISRGKMRCGIMVQTRLIRLRKWRRFLVFRAYLEGASIVLSAIGSAVTSRLMGYIMNAHAKEVALPKFVINASRLEFWSFKANHTYILKDWLWRWTSINLWLIFCLIRRSIRRFRTQTMSSLWLRKKSKLRHLGI